MPEFTYAGQMPRRYTELRDSAGDLVALVRHGETRDLDEAPSDGLWVESAKGLKVAPAPEGVSDDPWRPEGGDKPQGARPAGEPPQGAGQPAPGKGGQVEDDTKDGADGAGKE